MNESIRLCFGALALRPNGSGVQTYARELLHAMPAALSERGHGARCEAIIQSDAVGELGPGVEPRTRPVCDGARRALLGLAPVRGADLFHGLDVDLPVLGPGATVSTVHDLSVFDVPWAFSRIRAKGERALLGRALRRADLLIAVSGFTAERIWHYFRREAVVTPLAPAAWATPANDAAVAEARARYGLPGKFVLQVGTVEPRKELALVAEAARSAGVPFVIAGAGSTGPAAPQGARGLGYVPTADLPALYRAATVVAYASSYEGFGLPPVEAMACGAAVLASRVGGLPEVVGDGAELVASLDAEAWSAALRALVMDDAANADLRVRAARAISGLGWSRTAGLTVRAYESAGLL